MFSRLYDRRERDGRSQLEDYLTEVFAVIFERLDGEGRRSLLHAMIGEAARVRFDSAVPSLDDAEIVTQVVLDASGQRKRPDMVLRRDGRDILVIEVKLGAPIARHIDRNAPTIDGTDAVTISQLETYARWIAGRNITSDAWPGAVILLTAWTPPPAGFAALRSDGVLGMVRTWVQVAAWLKACTPSLDPVTRTLGAELLSFLKEKHIVDRHFNARDLAAVTFYVASKAALRHTFTFALMGVCEKYPDLGSIADEDSDTNSELGVYYSWLFLQRSLQVRGSSFYMAVGVCTGPGPHIDKETADIMEDEPFFMVYFGDDNGRHKAIERVSRLPDGWIEMSAKPALIAIRPVREFAGDPDRRAKELRAWAEEQVGRLVGVLKDYPAKGLPVAGG